MRKRKSLLSTTQRQRLLRTARATAEEAGRFVMARHRPQGRDMLQKGIGDFVTEVDLAAEKLCRRRILAEWPDHGVLGEELPAVGLESEFTWILDPIDGTSNFGRGLPTFAVSVACLYRGSPVATAVHCFPEDAVYHAAVGLGARRGRRRLELPRGTALGPASILGLQWHRGSLALPYFEQLSATGTRLRNLGCTVAQIADVAAGRLDGNVQEQGKLWDFAAVALLVTEAGGRFTRWTGEEIFPLAVAAADFDPGQHYPSIAAPATAHRQLCKFLAPFESELLVPNR